MQTTSLGTLISRMDRWKTINDIDEPSKVKDIDSAIRIYKRKYNFPWHLRKSTIKIFDGILEYQIADDHKSLAFIENDGTSNRTKEPFSGVYTSIKQFIDNRDDSNDVCEIWKDGEKTLGIRQEAQNTGSIQIDDASNSDYYSVSDDAVSLAEDTVMYKTDDSSIRVEVINNIGTANITILPTTINDSDYEKKYFFAEVYIESIPISIQLRFGNDSSNYLYSNITTQFSGESFKINQWNILAFDLNTASLVGTVDETSFDYTSLVFAGLNSGYLYIDSTWLREWSLKEYWYYSKNQVKSSTVTFPDKEYFTISDSYDVSDSLIGDSEFADLIMYEAMLIGINEKENAAIFGQIQGLRDEAWGDLVEKNPSLDPLIEETYYQFSDI